MSSKELQGGDAENTELVEIQESRHETGTEIAATIDASPEDLRLMYKAAFECLSELVPGNKNFIYSLPIETSIGSVRAQRVSNNISKAVKFEVSSEGNPSVVFTVDESGKLLFITAQNEGQREEVDLSRGVSGVLHSIAKNVNKTVKKAGIDKSAAAAIINSLDAEKEYYHGGEAGKDLAAIAKKMEEAGELSFQDMNARDKFDKPYNLTVNGLGNVSVNFSRGDIYKDSETLVMRYGMSGEMIQSITSSDFSTELRLPSSTLKDLRKNIESVNLKD